MGVYRPGFMVVAVACAVVATEHVVLQESV
jgi:hypothetical protein